MVSKMSTTTTAATKQYTPSDYFTTLTRAMDADKQFAGAVNRYIRATTGHINALVFFKNGASDEVKTQILTECLTAFRNGNYMQTLNAVPVPATPTSVALELPVPAASEGRGVEPSVPDREQDKEEEEDPELPVSPRRIKSDDATLQLVNALRAVVGDGPAKKSEIDETAIKLLINKRLAEVEKSLEEYASKRITGYLDSIPPRDSLEIKINDSVTEIEGATHWQLPQIITWVSANVPLWLWGGAGAGKTTIGRQIAQALNLEPYIISIDPTMTVGKLLGFRNLATGDFVEGFLYKPYKNGGLVKLDEIDTGDPGIIASINALLANDYYLFPNAETVARHKDFRVVAGANTKGCGAVAGYTARNRLDAATLDRFAVLELLYDEELERSIALGEPMKATKEWSRVDNDKEKPAQWVDWVQKVRKSVGQSVLVSPRASILGSRAIRAGIPTEEVAEALIFKLVTQDTRQNIVNQVGRFA